jgi:hypothetical protein
MSSARNRALGSFFSAFHVARQCFSLLLVPRIKALTPLGLCTRIHFTAEYYCQGLSFAAALTFVFSPAHSQGSRSVLAPFLAAAIVMFCSHDFGRQWFMFFVAILILLGSRYRSWAVGLKARVFLILIVFSYWFLHHARKVFNEMLVR